MHDRTDAPKGTPAISTQQGSVSYLALVCLVASLGGLLFGFDTAVISGTIERVAEQFQLDAVSPDALVGGKLLRGAFTSSALAGCIIGALIAGYLGDRFGRRPNLRVAAALFFISALFSAIPPSFAALIVARLVGGLGVGMASVLAPMYISEFAPPRWRGRLVAFYQLSIVCGILLAYLSNWLILTGAARSPNGFGGEGLLHKVMIDELWRGMFGAEMIPAGLFLLLLLLVPESPRWLIKAGYEQRGRDVLTRVSGATVADVEVREITKALAREKGSLSELFRPGLRIALLVGVMLSVFGQLSGVNIVIYYGPKILAAAGFAEAETLFGQVGIGLFNLIFTIAALVMIDHLGRRPLLIGGMAVVTVVLAVIGGLFLFGVGDVQLLDDVQATDAPQISRAVGLAIVAMICVYTAAIAFSICAVIWVLTPEIFPNRIRGRAVSICTFFNWGTNSIGALFFPWYVGAFGMHNSFFTLAAICLVATLFYWRFVPETKGKSLEAIERHWIEEA